MQEPRALTPELERRLHALRRLKRLLDDVFRLPGTNIHFGWDPVIGLVPWVGDLLAALLACVVLVQAHRMRIPRIVQWRMLLNVAIDIALGVVPFVGDAADVFWKSNSRNFALLERYAAEVRPASVGDWLFVLGIVGVVLALAVLPLVVVYWVAHALIGRVA